MSKSEVKKLFRRLEEQYGDTFPYKKGQYEICETDKDVSLVLFNANASFLLKKDNVVPALKMFLDKDVRTLPYRVIVDMGAIRFVTNGADIMRPGVVDIGPGLDTDSFVVIGDERHGKPLAIGTLLFSSDDILAKESGKVILNIHFVGDKIWNLEI